MLFFGRNSMIGDVIGAVFCVIMSSNCLCCTLNEDMTLDYDYSYYESLAVDESTGTCSLPVASVANVVVNLVDRDRISALIFEKELVIRKNQVVPVVMVADKSEHEESEEKVDNIDMGQKIADIAEEMVGTPYCYAGESTNGVDCSGLVVYCYSQLGVELPHSSYSLCNVGTEVAIEDIRPGDIICWDNQGGSCGHVGIYIGDGIMVDARGHSEGVIYGDLDLHPILTVRRIFE